MSDDFIPSSLSAAIPEPPDDLAVDRYVTGECSAAERGFVERWLHQNASDTAAVAAMRAHIGMAKDDGVAPDLTVLAESLRHRRHGATSPVLQRRTTSFRIALLAGLLGCLAIGFRGVIRLFDEQEISGLSSRQYMTPPSQSATVTLHDGTHVLLAPRTTIRVASLAEGTVIQLTGEAIFTVASRSATPLRVRAGGATVQVLGTIFGVRRYANDAAAHVFVAEGKVSVGTNQRQSQFTSLTVGTFAMITDSSVASEILAGADHSTLAQGRLVFHNAKVGDVLSVVSQWYGVAIRIADPAIAQRSVTAELDIRRTPGELFAALEAVLDLRIRRASMTDSTLIVASRSAGARGTVERRHVDSIFTFTQEMGR